jgi:MFS superfamily sulfate permease-like transporter
VKIFQVQLLYDVRRPTFYFTYICSLPSPSLPPFLIIKDMISNCIVIAIVSFTINFSVADVYAKKFKYSIDSTQELLATGISNVFASFFGCFTGCASLSRTAVQVTSGGKTQVASGLCETRCCLFLIFFMFKMVSILSSVLLVIILYTMTQLFYYVPKVSKMTTYKVDDLSIKLFMRRLRWLLSFLSHCSDPF